MSCKQLSAIIGIGVISLTLILVATGYGAAGGPRVQVFEEHLESGEFHVYDLPNLQKGETLFVYMQRISGTLDPYIGVSQAEFDYKEFEKSSKALRQDVREAERDLTEILPELTERFFLALNDDGGKGKDSALELSVREGGNYKLVAAGRSRSYGLSKIRNTFGHYRLIVGVNAPDILTGEAAPTGEKVASPSVLFNRRVQEITGTIAAEKPSAFFPLKPLDPGQTLFAFVEATSGELKPSLTLIDYSKKRVAFDNDSGKRKSAQLQYTFQEGEGRNYVLHVEGAKEGGGVNAGGFRLLVGTNTPAVLEGKAEPRGRLLVKKPINVNIAIQVDQITAVNQKNENFGIVGNLIMQWIDPDFAFSPDVCQCSEKTLEASHFDKLVREKGLAWPRFVFYNQQGRRPVQEEHYTIRPNGEVMYFERFGVTLQAPDFNFLKFPFDYQEFFIRIVCLEPIDLYVFKENPKRIKVGDQLGEEEWSIVSHDAQVSSVEFDETKSQFSLRLLTKRHQSYYSFRIFIPLLLIVIVSWVTFFRRDYDKRIDISGGNLLVFIAFNFTLGSDLPRLGYLTFMDVLLVCAFIITAFSVVINVILRRMETAGKLALAKRIDAWITWGYPVVCVVGTLLLVWYYFI